MTQTAAEDTINRPDHDHGSNPGPPRNDYYFHSDKGNKYKGLGLI